MKDEFDQTQDLKPADEIKVIRQMMEKTRTETAESGFDFLLWGWMALAGCILVYILVFAGYERLAWLPWITLMPLAAVIETIYHSRQSKKNRVLTYARIASRSLWIACGASMFLVAFLALPLKIIPLSSMSIVLSILIAIACFTTGYIIDWNLLKYSGGIWWATAILMMLVHWHWHMAIFAIALILGYLVPGYLLRKKYLRK
ncbi:MAG: hypothetical protein WCS36_00960 [Candidatus Neomarinimicrobiota bacterium]